jgi:hypothetical protein
MSDWNGPEDLDPECRSLCAALNGIDGLDTVESCCGHGIWRLYIVFDATDGALEQLRFAIADFEHWHLSSRSRWHALVGPTGEDAYAQAAELATRIGGSREPVPSERSSSAYPAWARAVSAEAARNVR